MKINPVNYVYSNKIFIFLLILFYSQIVISEPKLSDNSVIMTIKNDYKLFYCKDNLTRISSKLLTIGILANSAIDDDFQNWYQQDVKSINTNNYAKNFKLLGAKEIVFPILFRTYFLKVL